MKQKKIPMRMCVGCREMKPKRELVRLVADPEGIIRMDLTGKVSGRGAYLCRNEQCLDRAVKIRAVQHALEKDLTQEEIERLREEIRADA
ncbi:MAG: YlxR family protein [Clostridia bacterium]|nr:YlxR family protein [Clostridia bacterium]